ncbi:DUF6636 domain-containing protein [Roseivivax sp. CAU 1761]
MQRLLFIGLLGLATGARADGYGFMTPSGNIYCNGAVEASEITCTIVERSGPPAMARPGNCSASWGHEFHLRASGPARMGCSRAPRRVDYSDVAPYGQSGAFGAITCRSERTGLTCRNPSGHGFFLSRRSQQVF